MATAVQKDWQAKQLQEVLQGPAGKGVARQALELGAAGFDLLVVQGLAGGVGRAAGDVGVPAGAVVDP